MGPRKPKERGNGQIREGEGKQEGRKEGKKSTGARAMRQSAIRMRARRSQRWIEDVLVIDILSTFPGALLIYYMRYAVDACKCTGDVYCSERMPFLEQVYLANSSEDQTTTGM